jgi:membrane associated rhomboid family serine protease
VGQLFGGGGNLGFDKIEHARGKYPNLPSEASGIIGLDLVAASAALRYFSCGMELAGHSRIPSRTRRQTMDWGLVLMSQGIAATIDDGADGAGWGLWVSTAEYPAALRAIRLYRLENRQWHWRQPLPWRGFAFDGKVLFWGLLLVAVHVASLTSQADFQLAGRMDSAAVRGGEWWRVFTAMLLHADVAHLMSNVSFGLVFLGLAMGRFGSGLGLLAAYLAGAAGNVAGLLCYPEPHFGLGASGMVMGGLGLLAAQSVTLLRRGFIGRKQMLRSLLAGLMLFVLFGLSPGTDVLAHFTGFSMGLALGGVLLLLPPSWKNRKTDAAAAMIFGGVLVGTGWLAFH